MSLIYSHIYHSPIGAMLIQANEHNIFNLAFIETDQLSTIEVATTDTNSIIHQCIDELIEYFSGKRTSFTVPIHQEGTDFQQKVSRYIEKLVRSGYLAHSQSEGWLDFLPRYWRR